MAGLSDKGFEGKELDDILRTLRVEASRSFSDLVPDGEVVDTSDSTVIGRLTKLVAPSLADLWEAAQDVYSAFDPDTATGESLDNLVKYSRISRRGAESSVAVVRMVAQEGTTLPDNSSVASIDGQSWRLPPALSFSMSVGSNGANILFELLDVGEVISIDFSVAGIAYKASVTVEEGDTLLILTGKLVDVLKASEETIDVSTISEGLISIVRQEDYNDTIFSCRNCSISDIIRVANATSIRKERISAYAGEINRIETPVLGWKSVTNIYDAKIGRSIETDQELRERFVESKYTIGYTSADAIAAKIRGIDGVLDFIVYENDTSGVNEFGVEPHSFMPIVLGGDDLDIANTIWKNRPIGIKSQGSTVVDVVAIDGKIKEERFERPVAVPIKIKVELIKEYNFPENGIGRIKNYILDYFRDNYRIGEDVFYSKMFIPINSVGGHSVALLQLSKKDEEFGYNNIPILFNEVAVISYSDITVTAG